MVVSCCWCCVVCAVGIVVCCAVLTFVVRCLRLVVGDVCFSLFDGVVCCGSSALLVVY